MNFGYRHLAPGESGTESAESRGRDDREEDELPRADSKMEVPKLGVFFLFNRGWYINVLFIPVLGILNITFKYLLGIISP